MTQLELPFEPNKCSFEGCNVTINPATQLIDSDNGLPLCLSHGRKCDNCGKVHRIDELIEHKNESYKEYYCKECESALYAECPNCKEIVLKEDLLPPNSRNKWSMKQGGCTHCSQKCYACNRIVDNDDIRDEDGDKYCEDCWSNYFTMCDRCGDTVDQDSAHYVENEGSSYCDYCYNKLFTICKECEKEIEKSDAVEYDGDDYCQSCYDELNIGPEEYNKYTQDFSQISYTKKDKYIDLLKKIVPISVKELKTKHPSIAAGLNDLISFNKGKDITLEVINNYRKSLAPEEFPVEYTTWGGIQRSIHNLPQDKKQNIKREQLVLNIVASSNMLAKLKSDPILYALFNNINNVSYQSGHPYVFDQIGWARLELDPNKEYILVDEIQSDHSNATLRLKQKEDEIRTSLMEKYKLTDEHFDKLLSQYYDIIKDFPNIATQAISNFARKNNFKKIFWHTYDSGRNLKNNDPPKSIYDKVPKENMFKPSLDSPFGLRGEFFEKEAKTADKLYKLAVKLYIKNIGVI